MYHMTVTQVYPPKLSADGVGPTPSEAMRNAQNNLNEMWDEMAVYFGQFSGETPRKFHVEKHQHNGVERYFLLDEHGRVWVKGDVFGLLHNVIFEGYIWAMPKTEKEAWEQRP